MSIEVIVRGQPPEEKVYEEQCRRCASMLRFKRADAKYTADQRDGDFLTVECPVCHGTVHAQP